MAMTASRMAAEPMAELNTTPLIDIMLVLLIMFIVTIPIQTHAVKVDLPSGVPPRVEVSADMNKVTIDRSGVTTWNGRAIDDAALVTALARTRALPIEPELHFEPDPQARYDVVDRVLSVIKRSGASKMGFVGNERYRDF